jgi:hypothetical protein
MKVEQGIGTKANKLFYFGLLPKFLLTNVCVNVVPMALTCKGLIIFNPSKPIA